MSNRILRFHERAFTLHQRAWKVRPDAEATIGAIERRLQCALPAAVREWYSLENCDETMRGWSNEDHPISSDKLGVPLRGDGGWGPEQDWLKKGLLPLLVENQSCAVWAVALDGTDDPPVLVDNGTEGGMWVRYADSFSEFIYVQAWDALVMSSEFLAFAGFGPLSESALSGLNSQCRAVPMTHGWPDKDGCRFEAGDQRVLIWSGETQAYWYVSAGTEESLEKLIRSLGPLEGVRGELDSRNEASRRVLQRVRAFDSR